MGHLDLTPHEYERLLATPFIDERLVGDDLTTVIVRGRADSIPGPGALPLIVVWIGEAFGGNGPDAADVVVADAHVADLLATVDAAPVAATTLAVLLRIQPRLGVEEGLAAESAAYSTMQAGAEFAAWRSTARFAADSATSPTVRAERDGDELTITLDRPHRHNAIDTRLRDELVAALELANADDSIHTVHLRGAGPSFCSGGDLAEFGSRPDPAIAHRTRLARSPARLIDRLGERCIAHVHGAVYGGGIEMAAFARRVAAHPDSRFALPEIGLGLIPGAGGTVSVTRRIGRQRTAALGLSGTAIDAGTALDWRLIDAIDETLFDNDRTGVARHHR